MLDAERSGHRPAELLESRRPDGDCGDPRRFADRGGAYARGHAGPACSDPDNGVVGVVGVQALGEELQIAGALRGRGADGAELLVVDELCRRIELPPLALDDRKHLRAAEQVVPDERHPMAAETGVRLSGLYVAPPAGAEGPHDVVPRLAPR